MTATRVLVLGANGMLGHRVGLAATAADDLECWGTVRAERRAAAPLDPTIVAPERLLVGLDASVDPAAVAGALADVLARAEPHVVVNGIGLIKQRPDGGDADVATAVNTRFPHLVAEQTTAAGIALIHLSTDCVFDGQRGGYAETDPPSATDVYGRSKADGEPSGTGVCVLRTSMIGRELHGASGLLEWFLGAESPVRGFRNARFSGLTTPVLADVIVDLVRRPELLAGLWHVAADPIDKASLLQQLADRYGRDVEIEPVDEPHIDRTLDGSRFAAATGFVAPPWRTMLSALAADDHPYEQWRKP